jgi:dTDP-glucose pyrophosphorylase
MRDYRDHLISNNFSTSQALSKLSSLAHDLTLFVVDENERLLGTLTDGDIRRGLIKGYSVNDLVTKFMRSDFKCIRQGEYTLEEIKSSRDCGITLLPVVNKNMEIQKLINLNDQQTILPITAVIMAGGEGQRLRPLTETVPKSLLKVGKKPIIEHVIDRFVFYGIDTVKISVNYLAEQVIDYFNNISVKQIDISYIKEEQKLGTAGALALLNTPKHDTILLMNADLLTNINFEDFYTQFLESGADMMVGCIPYSVNIPYAVFELDGKKVSSLKEKPTYTYYSNAGIYMLKSQHLHMVPKNKPYNATDFIEDLIQKGMKVIYYPILGFWLDIGNHEDFHKANKYLEQNSI